MAEKVIIEYEVKENGVLVQTRKIKQGLEDTEKAGEKAASGFSKAAKAAVALGSALAAAQIVRFLRDSVQAAQEQQQVFTSLGVAMKNAGVNYNDVGRELQTMLGHLQATTKYGDTDTAATLQRLVAITGDYDAALKLLNPTLDFATAMNVDLATAARLAGQAATGMTGTLSRYGVVLTDATREQIANADAMERAEIMAAELSKRFGGSAASELTTYAGRIQQMSNYWGDFSEVVGDIIVKTSAAPSVMGKLVGVFETLTGWAKRLGAGIVAISAFDYGTAAAAGVKKVLAQWMWLFAQIKRQLATLPAWMGGDDYEKQANAIEWAAKELNKLADIELEGVFNDTTGAVKQFADAVDNVAIGLGGATGDAPPGSVAGNAELVVDMMALTGKETIKVSDYMRILAENRIPTIAEQMEAAAKRGGDVFYTVEESAEKSFSQIETSFSDLLGKGFMGKLETFGDLWNEVWQDLAKSMTGILGDVFDDMFGGAGGSNFNLLGKFKGFYSGMKDTVAQNPLGSGIAGAGMMYSGYEQGGTGGMIQGAMGGLMIGLNPALMAATGGLSAIIGPILGGAATLFGGEDPTRYQVSVGANDAFQTRLSGPGPSGDARHLQLMEMQERYRASIMSMNSVLRLFNDGALFDFIKDSPEFFFQGEASFDEIVSIFSEQWLPTAMKEMFRGAINRGLKNFDVDAATRQQLWEEISGLTGTNQIQGLETYISALVGTSNLMADMDWNVIQDESRMNSFQSFMAGMTEIADAVDMQMLGIGDMTLLERAEQAQTVEQLITQARQAEIQFLRQIDSLQQGINRSINQQIEGIMTGGMSRTEQIAYYDDQISGIMSQLRGGVDSPEQLQMLMGDLQRYVGSYQGVIGDSLYSSGPDGPFGGGGSWADYLMGILGEAQGLSDMSFDSMRDQVQNQNQVMIDQLSMLTTALTSFEASLLTDPPKTEVNITVDGNMAPLINVIAAVVQDQLGNSPQNTQAPIS